MSLYQNKKMGFSLIELLVVVAIISVLAAIAVPLYQNYSIRAKISTLMPVLNQFSTQIQTYYQRTGNWPSASDLNLPNVFGTILTNSYSPYLAFTEVALVGNGGAGFPCGTLVSFEISASNVGKPGGTWPSGQANLALVYQLYSTQGGTVISTRCAYGSQNSVDDAVYLPSGCNQPATAPICS